MVFIQPRQTKPVSDRSPKHHSEHPGLRSEWQGIATNTTVARPDGPEPPAHSAPREGQRHLPAERPEDTLEKVRKENLRLRRELRALAREAEKNEGIYRRFQGLELSLLNAESLPDLIDRIVNTTRDILRLDDAMLILHDPDHEIRNLLAENALPFPVPLSVRLTDDPMPPNPAHDRAQGPWLGPYRDDHACLFSGSRRFGSVALLPLIAQGYLFGNLNLASTDPVRYTRSHASDFHSRLASVASLCLQNAINRERLVISSRTDLLTRWYNRRYLDIRLPHEVARAVRYSESLCCLMLDVDHFKQINDRYGHPVGDIVLRDIAGRIKNQLRTSDLAVRFGGEEFVVFLIHTTEKEAVIVAERIRSCVAATPFCTQEGHSLRVTLSGGIAELLPGDRPSDPVTLGDAMLHRADAALYRAKAGGRNQIVCAGWK